MKQNDRDILKQSASTLSTHVTLGSLFGVGLGLFLAYRLRTNRTAMFNAFKASEKPTSVRFASGREEAIPDVTPFLRPSTLGDVATYSLLGAGGLFFGGETGLLTGTFRARQVIGRDSDSRERIETAFRKFQADALRRQADLLDRGSKVGDSSWSL